MMIFHSTDKVRISDVGEWRLAIETITANQKGSVEDN